MQRRRERDVEEEREGCRGGHREGCRESRSVI